MNRSISVSAVTLGLVFSLAGCQLGRSSGLRDGATTSSGSTIELENVAWTQVELAEGFNPSVVAPAPGDAVLIGGDADAAGRRGAPSLLLVRNDGVGLPTQTQAKSYYGRRAEWGGLAIDPQTTMVFGFGGRRGGAHTNVRWTAWAGPIRGQVSEQTQTFETFGGPQAGEIVGVLVADGQARLVGSWQGERNGLDIAVWSLHDDVWTRGSSAGTALASTESVQNSAQAAAARGKGAAIVGTITTFRDGHVTTKPGLWTSPSPDGPWTRVEIPAPDSSVGQGQAITCDSDGNCLILGVEGGILRGWTLSPDGAIADADVPRLPIDSPDGLAAPWGSAGHRVAAVPSGDGGSVVLVQTGDSWREFTGGPGTPTGVAQLNGTVYETVRTVNDGQSPSTVNTMWTASLL